MKTIFLILVIVTISTIIYDNIDHHPEIKVGDCLLFGGDLVKIIRKGKYTLEVLHTFGAIETISIPSVFKVSALADCFDHKFKGYEQ